MKDLETQVEFRSDLFPPDENEGNEINPGRYGKRLAEFIQRGLRSKGLSVGEPIPQDWGWVVPVDNDAFPLWIGCGNYDEYPRDGFLCFIEPHTPTIRKWFKKIDTTERVSEVRDALDAILTAEPGVRNERWWTYDEFNKPRPR